jgi:hypothetical protein
MQVKRNALWKSANTAVADTFAKYKTGRVSQIKHRNTDPRAAQNQKGREYKLDVKQVQEGLGNSRQEVIMTMLKRGMELESRIQTQQGPYSAGYRRFGTVASDLVGDT